MKYENEESKLLFAERDKKLETDKERSFFCKTKSKETFRHSKSSQEIFKKKEIGDIMAKIQPFQAIRPQAVKAAEIAALPYDVYNRKEAKEEVQRHPHSFLSIDRPETQFPDDADMYAPAVYEKAKELLWHMVEEGTLFQEKEACFYLYEISSSSHAQTGLVACAAIDDYLNQVIKRHENTKPEKEADRIRHVQTCGAQTGPIFLAHRPQPELRRIIDIKKRTSPVYNFISQDHIRHRVWVVKDKASIRKICEIFQQIDSIYIADGHHRAASAIKAGMAKREENPAYTGEEEFNYFLCTLFPSDELYIMDYNRVVKDLNGYSKEAFLEKLKERFEVKAVGETPVVPEKKGVFGMYLKDGWYRLELKEAFLSTDAVEGLDVAALQREVLAPVLGIEKPGEDSRIEFVGGIRGLEELERRVQTDCAVAFSMYPTSMEELMQVADEGRLMPAKSTWFEPKLRSGLFIHKI